MNNFDEPDVNEQIYPGINIAYAIVSPITNEILFVDTQNNIITSNDPDVMILA